MSREARILLLVLIAVIVLVAVNYIACLEPIVPGVS